MASTSLRYLARRSGIPAAAYIFSSVSYDRESASCDAPPPTEQIPPVKTGDHTEIPSAPHRTKAGMTGGGEEQGDFHGLFPKRQLWQPKVDYPLWDHDWDSRREPPSGDKEADKKRERELRKTGVTRHIILIRHGQYDETHKEDEKRLLTPLGRKQADLTGKRLAEMVKGIEENEKFGPCNVKVLRVSNMARAKETADIIASHLPDIERSDPDPLLNEGRPSHHIPGGKATPSIIKRTDENHARIEEAFAKYIHRADAPKETVDDGAEVAQPQDGEEGKPTPNPKHEFEVIVCHANVIRYFLCRALQLPPEAWLRLCTFNCSLNYLTIRPTGTVSVRMVGDIGHLGYDHSTFSMHHGYNW